jgi:O-antigen/teichoic acid export membrane protein
MKVNFVMLLIALAVAVLIAFGFYSGNKGEPYVWLITIASGGFGFVTLSGVMAVRFNARGSTGNVVAISIVFFVISLISNIIFSFLTLKLTPYVIINGILFLIYILIGYGTIKALKED